MKAWKKKFCLICCLIILALMFIGCEKTVKTSNENVSVEKYEISFVDDLGKEVKMKEPAKKIISFYSAHTENLFSLGLDEEIIGVGKSDIYPPKALEKKVYDYRSDPEKVIAAEPDLVLIRPFVKRSAPEFVRALESAGINMVALYPDTFEKFDDYFKKLGILTGKEENVENLLENFYSEIDDIKNKTANIDPKVKVYFESVETDYKTVTTDSMPARAMEIAGGINIASDAKPIKEGSSIAAYGVERILENADEIDVFVSQRGAMNAGGNLHSISIRPGFDTIKALRNKNVFVINQKIISSPNLRYLKGIKELSRMFYPEIFDDIAKFDTEEELTRDQMAELVVKFNHKEVFVPTSSYYRKKHDGHTYGAFKDVMVDNSYFDFIETAIGSGYMDSYKENGNEFFYPERKVTREEFAKILYMICDLKNDKKEVKINDLNNVSNPKIIQIIVNNGIMTIDKGCFNPEQFITGKQAVKILNDLRDTN